MRTNGLAVRGTTTRRVPVRPPDARSFARSVSLGGGLRASVVASPHVPARSPVATAIVTSGAPVPTPIMATCPSIVPPTPAVVVLGVLCPDTLKVLRFQVGALGRIRGARRKRQSLRRGTPHPGETRC